MLRKRAWGWGWEWPGMEKPFHSVRWGPWRALGSEQHPPQSWPPCVGPGPHTGLSFPFSTVSYQAFALAVPSFWVILSLTCAWLSPSHPSALSIRVASSRKPPCPEQARPPSPLITPVTFHLFAISVTLSLEPDQGPPRARLRLSCSLLPHEAQSILGIAQARGVAERQLRSSGAPGSWG